MRCGALRFLIACRCFYGCSGEPDVATRILLRKLKNTFNKIRFYGIFDCNPHGALIYSTYPVRSEERSHDNLLPNVPDLEFIGLSVTDVGDEDWRPFDELDTTLLKNMLVKDYLEKTEMGRVVRANLTQLLSIMKKADIEVLVKRKVLEDFIKHKIKLSEERSDNKVNADEDK